MRTAFILTSALALLILTSAEGFSQVLDDRANMKILKTRAKLATGSSTYVYSNGQLDALADLESQIRSQVNCGSVDIANQTVDSSFSGEINIIIAGDVVNTGNNCR
ncbi:hypothetical protein RYZ26_02450 [Terasakiella sp. A23]|uniref:hypothetical protein n=1 Tax=Terasakiella sp. FCG-A23 TaxID=3080561 RepID=UPI002954BFC9|nr:hypothetical protein [Terasakiella sp. A23]MDV7338441.1 hypothetical protein [Terasakiella sp. A23]